jgi:hypothetical protein
MSQSSALPPASTFVIRFWREPSPVPHWRGQITHLESGEKVAFLDLEKMVRFLQRLGIMADPGPAQADTTGAAQGE